MRLFQPPDREAVQRIGAETAFFGQPIERYMEDRRVFMDAFYAYYTDYEPEHCWVAVAKILPEADAGSLPAAKSPADEQVVGFLTGCVDTHRHDALMQRRLIPGVVWNLLRGRYHPGLGTYRYALSAAGAVLRGEIPGPDLRSYPAHLHINLLPEWRGLGLGRRLMEAYLRQLRGLGVPGVFLQTTSLNVAAVHLYEAVGFRLLGARKTRMYRHLLADEVENRCYGLAFRQAGLG